MLDEEGVGYSYDAENKLVAIYNETGTNGQYDPGTDTLMAEYAYDALGRRIEFVNHFDRSGIYGSSATKVTTRYVYDGQNVIEEYNTNGDRQSLTRGTGFAGRAEHEDASVRRVSRMHGSSYIDERVLLHDDDDPHSGADAADYYYLLKDLYTVVGLVNKQGHEVESLTHGLMRREQVSRAGNRRSGVRFACGGCGRS